MLNMKRYVFLSNVKRYWWYIFFVSLFFVVGCVNPTETNVELNNKKAAEFKIIEEKQDKYDAIEEWGTLTVTYTIQNTGNVAIDYYTVTFVVTLKDGGKIEDYASGTDIPTGDTAHQKSMVIDTQKKQFDKVEIASYELKNVSVDED